MCCLGELDSLIFYGRNHLPGKHLQTRDTCLNFFMAGSSHAQLCFMLLAGKKQGGPLHFYPVLHYPITLFLHIFVQVKADSVPMVIIS